MAPAQVAYGIWAAYGMQVTPVTITAWEHGDDSPTEAELAALAGALWCSPADLLGTPNTLREHRMARGIPASDLALQIGMEAKQYEQIEESGRWTGNERQATALGEALELPLPAFLKLTGRSEKVADMLRSAVTTRWQAYVRPLEKQLPLPRHRIEDVLDQLHGDYHKQMYASLNWGEGTSAEESHDAGRAFLKEILDHFWERIYS